MTENSGSTTRALLVSYIEKIAAGQASIQELNREIGQLRQDARVDGFNMEAVYLLGQILAKSPHDGGAGLLTDILQYARQSGISSDAITAEKHAPGQVHKWDYERDSFGVSRFAAAPHFAVGRLSLLIQFALGIIVTGSFIWLLH